MLVKIICYYLLIFSSIVFAENNSKEITPFDIIPLNSPVKGPVAKFKITSPASFEIAEIKYKIINSHFNFSKQQQNEKLSTIAPFINKEIQIPVSQLNSGFYQLFIEIRDRKNKVYVYHNEFKDYVKFSIDNSLKIKIPDPKINNSTLLGIDSDKDGIRDDAQQWINENTSSTPNVKLALRQYGISIQSSLSLANNKEESITANFKLIDAAICNQEMGEKDGLTSTQASELKDKLKAIYLNTKERIETQFKINENFNGQLIRIPSREEACSF